jgi:ABC-type transporter Mla subunit MlaD
VLIDARVSRDFLEQAQRLGAEMGHALAVMDRASDGAPPSTKRLDAAVKQLKAAAVPLMAQLTPEEQAVVMGGDAS